VRSDKSGVAGFFEDLPVLAFVLVGSCVLIASGILTSEANAQKADADRLHKLASSLGDSLVAELLQARPGLVPSISTVCTTALEEVAESVTIDRNYCFSILMLHPELRFICNLSSEERCADCRVAAASRLMNASIDDGLVVILLVRVLVW